MDVFHGNAGVIESHVIVAEIPKGFYPKLNEQGNKLSGTFGRNTEHGHFGQIFSAEFVQPVDMSDRNSLDHLAGESLLTVKNANKGKTLCFKGDLI